MRGAEPVAVEPQVFDLLVFLVQNRDRVVSKDDLIDSIWGGRVVSDSTLTSRINAARKAVNDNGKDQRLIRTMPRKGLRFIGTVDDTSTAKARKRLQLRRCSRVRTSACTRPMARGSPTPRWKVRRW